MYDPGDYAERHPAVRDIMRWFDHEHLSYELASTAFSCRKLAEMMVETLPDGPELTAGLRKLLEAKDCFVRAAISED